MICRNIVKFSIDVTDSKIQLCPIGPAPCFHGLSPIGPIGPLEHLHDTKGFHRLCAFFQAPHLEAGAGPRAANYTGGYGMFGPQTRENQPNHRKTTKTLFWGADRTLQGTGQNNHIDTTHAHPPDENRHLHDI